MTSLRVFVGFVCAALLTGCGSGEQAPSADAQETAAPPARDASLPNILVIVADDLGYTDLGSFGGEIATPNLDRLAHEGLRLTNFHTASSCAPTRAMLITGTDHHLAGMGSQSGLETELQTAHPAYQNRLREDVPTIAEIMRAAGYRTLASAKWHLGHEPEARPGARGFDRSFVLLEGGGGHFDDMALFERYEAAHWLEDDQPAELPDDFYSTDYMGDKMISYIEAGDPEQPFFAYLGYTAPHWPLQAPPESIAEYAGRYDEGWDALREARMSGAREAGVVAPEAEAVAFEPGMSAWLDASAEEQRVAARKMEVYAAMIDRMDESIGRVLASLEARGQLDTTVIVFMADNGAEAHLMELAANRDGWLDKNFDPSFEAIGTARSYVTLGPNWARATAVPYRDSKSKISEGGIRVPAFVRVPGGRQGIEGGYVRVMDLAPTFMALAGVEAEPEMMGRSVLALWQDGEAAYSDDEVIAYEIYGRLAAQRGRFKALKQEAPYGTGEWELYDLAADPGEQNDLADGNAPILKELQAGWEAYAERVGVVLPEHDIRY